MAVKRKDFKMKNRILKIPFSVLDLAPVLHGKTVKDTFESSMKLAQTAEKLGYNRFWLAEHHNMPGIASSATSILIGHIAGGTQKIRVGSGGIMLPNHSPLMVAEQFGTLGTLYPNRIDLGLGRAPGTDQLTARALNRDQRAVYEFPQNIQLLQRYFSVENSRSAVRAIPGEGVDIPIWILGSSTDSAYLAAELGLPYVFASHFAPAHLFRAVEIYKENFKPSEQSEKPYFLACVNVIAADTNEEAELLATSYKRMILGILTGNRSLLQPADENFILSADQELALHQMTKYSFIGNKQKVESGLSDFIDATEVDELMTTSYIYDLELKLKSLEILKSIQD